MNINCTLALVVVDIYSYLHRICDFWQKPEKGYLILLEPLKSHIGQQ